MVEEKDTRAYSNYLPRSILEVILPFVQSSILQVRNITYKDDRSFRRTWQHFLPICVIFGRVSCPYLEYGRNVVDISLVVGGDASKTGKVDTEATAASAALVLFSVTSITSVTLTDCSNDIAFNEQRTQRCQPEKSTLFSSPPRHSISDFKRQPTMWPEREGGETFDRHTRGRQTETDRPRQFDWSWNCRNGRMVVNR